MESPGIYKVVIESSNGREKYQKEYIGPAKSQDHAIEQPEPSSRRGQTTAW